MRTAGVVADHTGYGAVLVGRRVRGEGQAVLFRSVAQPIIDETRLDPRKTSLRIHLEQAVEMLGEVDHNGHIAGLAREARPSAAAKDWDAVLAADRGRCNHVFNGLRDDNPDRHLAVM